MEPVCLPFRCVLLGSGTLSLQCADMLLRAGHGVVAVVSDDEALRQWAAARDIPQFTPDADLGNLLDQQPFDYLFCIVYPYLVPVQVLALPLRGAINYHDSPLPRYAGTHATFWAMFNQEQMHGVTWHLMTEEIDAGPILQQQSITIAPDETTFSLNAKCYAAALNLFAKLLDELAAGTAVARPQDLSQRSYMPLAQRPPATGLISWHWSASRIAGLLRALDFGVYPNEMGLPKLLLGDDLLLVDELTPLPHASNAAPGTITALTANTLNVATAQGQVRIGALATLEGQPVALDELAARYGLRPGDRLPELAAEQLARITALHSELTRHERFWVERLATLEPLTLPYAVRPTLHPGHNQHRTIMSIPPAVAAFLRQAEVDNPAEWLLAAWLAFLARLNDRYAFDIGLSTSKVRQELGDASWFFAPVLPLRVALPSTQPVVAWHQELRRELARLHRRRSFVRDIGGRYPELRGRPIQLPLQVALIDSDLEQATALPDSQFTLLLPQDASAWACIYDAAIWDAADINRMQEQFVAFLAALLAAPATPIGALPLLTAAQRQHMLHDWNLTSTALPDEPYVHQLFAEQVRRSPDAIALVHGDVQISYAALDRRANQLAHTLQQHGVGPESLVAVQLNRDPALIVALLAVLKAGAAYLPLDPTYPVERLAWMRSDAQPRVLITQADQQPTDPADAAASPGYAIIHFDEHWRSTQPDHAPANAVTPDNLAYVIYTSGSTGRPKGVMISQRSLCNLVLAQIQAFDIRPDSRVVQFASVSFDASVSEVFTTLVAGATLHLGSRAELMPGSELLQFLDNQAITTATLPPSLLAVLPTHALPALRTLVSAGEACSAAIVARWAPGRRFINAYGPTEGTVCATLLACTNSVDANSIGQPIANVQVYLLDSALQPVPLGLAGELYISGVGLARGYLQRPDLTAERFIPNPFAQTAAGSPASRLYRTGDIARWLPNGTLEFLGRRDHQVKLRGFRIETGEIETVLNQHPRLRRSVVLLREDLPGNRQLVAYAEIRDWTTAMEEASVASIQAELRTFLKDRLPDYMIPTAIIPLDTLPLTRNGKIDRQALPSPEQHRALLATPLVVAHTPMEKLVATIWKDVLGIQRIGVSDNFFELGGHSLLATQVVGRIRAVVQEEVPLAVLMSAEPTVSATARAIERFQIEQAEVQDIIAVLQQIDALSDIEVEIALGTEGHLVEQS